MYALGSFGASPVERRGRGGRKGAASGLGGIGLKGGRPPEKKQLRPLLLFFQGTDGEERHASARTTASFIPSGLRGPAPREPSGPASAAAGGGRGVWSF